MLTQILPSYVYTQYADDVNVQAFASAYNQLAQSYLDTFNGVNLPVYTGLNGALLDWVAQGLYGKIRPSLPVLELKPPTGPYGTSTFGTLPFGALRAAAAPNYILATDDIFKRCLTWALYKGDGKQYSTRWLKRRVARFLSDENGQFDQTYRISVGYGPSDSVTIRIVNIVRTVTGGSVLDRKSVV